MTKCRGQAQLNEKMTLEASIKKEADFFSTKEPWCSEPNKMLFGINSLREKLAGVQVKMIEDSMPGILSQIAQSKLSALKELEALGLEIDGSGSRRSVFDTAKESLCTSLNQSYEGTEANALLKAALSDSSGFNFCTQMQRDIDTFGADILKLELNNITKKVCADMEVIVEFDDGSDDVVGIVWVVDGSIVQVKPKANDSRTMVLFPYVYADVDQIRFGSFPLDSVRPNLSWLRERLARNRTCYLPCFLSPQLFNSIVLELVRVETHPRCLGLLDAMYERLHALIEKAVDVCFPDSFPRLKMHVSGQLRALAKRSTTTLRLLS